MRNIIEERTMKKVENECVGCPPEIGCIGCACPYIKVERNYCDMCGDDGAKYVMDGFDYCEECANKYLHELFDELTIKRKAEVLEVDIGDIE